MGYVYVITDIAPEEGPNELLTNVSVVKIGFTSNDVDYRIAQLQTGNAKKLHLVYLYEFETQEMAKQAEKMCHSRLSGLEAIGEWFYYSARVDSVLKSLKGLCNQFESCVCPDEEAFASVLTLEVSNG